MRCFDRQFCNGCPTGYIGLVRVLEFKVYRLVFKEGIVQRFQAIIVSHDREFLDGLVDKVYEFGGGKVVEHLGGIYDYLRARNASTIQEAIDNKTDKVTQTSAPSESNADNKQSYLERKEWQKKLNKAEKAVKECENRIAKMEQRIKELDALLADPKNASNMELVTEYTTIKQNLDEENEQWFTLSESLSELKNKV